jgi:hypothetical protein
MRETVWLAIGMGLLAGCSGQRSSGVMPLADGSYRVAVASRDLGGAAQRALGQASAHCSGQGGQALMLRRQINAADYDLVFRCADAAAPPRNGAAPILLGSAAPAATGMPQPAMLPREPRTLVAPGARTVPPSAGGRLPPVPDLPPLRRISVQGQELAVAPLPAMQPAFSALPPRPPAPRAYESLPPVTGMPGGPPPRPLTPLPPIAEPALAGPPLRQGAASPTPPSAFWDFRRN